MKKMTRIAAAVALVTASASASSWWGAPWGDQSRMLEAQRKYAERIAAEQARVLQAQQNYWRQFAANAPDPARRADAEAFSPMPAPRPFSDPYRGDPLTWTSPLDPFAGPMSAMYEERLKESEARREEWRKARDLRRTETDSRREAGLKKVRERRQARLKYVGLRKPFDLPTREEI